VDHSIRGVARRRVGQSTLGKETTMARFPSTRLLLALALALPALASAPGAASPREAAIDARVDLLLKKLSLEEKIALLSGTGFDTRSVERLEIGGLHMSDGPVGVRTGKATAWPSSISTAASFDPDLVRRIGAAIAREAKAKGKNVVLGPCVNIQRVPQGGRNFESYGEDPYLDARMAVAYIEGMQSEGVAATVKHYALNNQEYERDTIDVQADERTIREIYLPQFEAAVKEAGVQAVMCSYNKLNGPWACENPWLLTDVLKKEWGFRGLVMSDWGATHSTAKALDAGLDLEMPDGQHLNEAKVKAALAAGELDEATIDEAVRRQLRVQAALGWLDRPLDEGALDTPAHRALDREAAAAGMVLLKNEGALLPLDSKTLRTVAVIGPNAAFARTGGGGSAYVSPIYAVTPLEGIEERLGAGVKVDYAPGATFEGDLKPVPGSALRPPAGRSEKQGLLGEYFGNEEWKGEPSLVRVDPEIDWDWGPGGPGGWDRVDHFSIRWTGTITAPETGRYALGVTSDDGSWLYLDGQLVVDNGGQHGMNARSKTVELRAGEPHEIRLDMNELGGGAGVILGWQKVEGDPIDVAVAKARGADVALVFVGHTNSIETEGRDRETLELPENQVKLLRAVAAANPKTVVVLNTGAPVLVEGWRGEVPALLETWFAGSETGHAVADVLFGDADPAGRLPMTWPKRWEDAPAYGHYPGADGKVSYAEGILVGYRYYDTKKIEPRFAFGYGLSYTTFEYSDLTAAPVAGQPWQVEVAFGVKNTGARAGAEVAQVYVHDAQSSVPRPEQELKGFRRLSLKPGEAREVRLVLDERAFSFFDPTKKAWVAEPGDFEIRVGGSSRRIHLRRTVTLP
jgi:beta-glucosidase